MIDIKGNASNEKLDGMTMSDSIKDSADDELSLRRTVAVVRQIDGVSGGADYLVPAGTNNLTLENGGTASDPNNLGVDKTNVPGFVSGTMIATVGGQIAAEDLREGDKVITRDNGIQEIRWIGSRKVAAVGKMAPVKFEAGVLGNNDTALWLSPNHRVLRVGWELEFRFETNEVLLPAKFLVGQNGVSQVSGGEVEYFHILLDNHQVILSNGAWTESFHPGHEGMGAFADDVRQEILSRFPHLQEEGGFSNYGTSARMCPLSYKWDIKAA